MKIINEQQFKDILEKHGRWLRNEENGERADLRYANLSSADLRYADLRYANLNETYGFNFKPLQVVNTKFFITIFDDYVQWGCRKLTFDEVKKFELKDCDSEWNESEFKLNRKIVTELIGFYRTNSCE